MDVWREIRDDTTLIFQWESNSAQAYLRKFMSDETIDKVRGQVPNFSMIKWLSFGNGLIRPGCASYRDDVAEGNFYHNGLKELDEFLAPTLGRVAMQEDIMSFLKAFCGYSDAESDNVRRAIAKKYGTETLLPEIAERFTAFVGKKYGLDPDRCESIITPFLQVIQDASDYSFSWNHSDSYSCIGYICGYLRHYYPLEFVTAALNVFSDNEEKTTAITVYAQEHHINITAPKFGESRSFYTADRDRGEIHKGIASIKYLNDIVPEELYQLSQNRNYTLFTDLLMDMAGTSINSRQLDILMAIDYFSPLGNSRELGFINNAFVELGGGTARSVKKGKIGSDPNLNNIMQKYAADTKTDGTQSDTYTYSSPEIDALKAKIQVVRNEANAAKRVFVKKAMALAADHYGRPFKKMADLEQVTHLPEINSLLLAAENAYAEVIDKTTDLQQNLDECYKEHFALMMHDIEQYIRSLNLPDISLKTKMANQLEHMGYIDLTTGRPEDRKKILITDIAPLKNKDNGNIWGYALFVRSVGTGKMARLTLRSKLYNQCPVEKGNILLSKDIYKNEAGYWYLQSYQVLE